MKWRQGPSSPPPDRLEPTLMSFIWRYSSRHQFALLAITLLSFPVLYASLELPKRILNDAIGGTEFPLQILGVEFMQLPFLLLLSFAFLLMVLCSGLIKMRLNIYKGIVGERLLRRLRFRLITHVLRFPASRFRRTSQGEVVSMVTAEVEPLSGIMGDALALPLFQAGQMLTILTFLFIQNPWFGLAAVALVPLQAIITPLLQRRINRLHRERVRRVRKLSELIGECVQGLDDLRSNGGTPYALAIFSHRLGGIFQVRGDIFRKKFFMKFLNNFINNLPPFLFYAVGGYLVIQGSLSIGALVAAITAYKDIVTPWRELLNYISQIQETSDRYKSLRDQFQPDDLMAAELFEEQHETPPRLNGPIRFDQVSITDANGSRVLSDISLQIPPGSMVAVQSHNAAVRKAFSQLLSRSVSLSSGTVTIGEHNLCRLNQAVISARVGIATSTPYLFNASVGENIYMPLRRNPRADISASELDDPELQESLASGNSTYPVNAEWLDLNIARFNKLDELNQWWLMIVDAMGSEDYLSQRALDARFEPSDRPSLAEKMIEFRPRLARRLADENLARFVNPFGRDRLNPSLTLTENLLFAIHIHSSQDEHAATTSQLIKRFNAAGFGPELEHYARGLLDTLINTFASIGSSHPIFKRLGGLNPETFQALQDVQQKQQIGRPLTAAESELRLSLPFMVTAEQLDMPLPDSICNAVLSMREACAPLHEALLQSRYRPLDEHRINPGISVLENLIFGKLARAGETNERNIRSIIAEELLQAGLHGPLSMLIRSIPVGLGGAEVPPIAQERFAFLRATIKKPDILVLDQALASHSLVQRNEALRKIRRLLPETTILVLEPAFANSDTFDLTLKLEDGHVSVDGSPRAATVQEPETIEDFESKRKVIASAAAFAKLSTAHVRLLAYASHWVRVDSGEYLFRYGDPPDGAYIVVEGQAELCWPDALPGDEPISEVGPGRLIGDLSVIVDQPRNMNLLARNPVLALRIERRELLEIIENDAVVAMHLLRTVSGHLFSAAETIRGDRGSEHE
ncbi:ABC transporter transmembrane domain-containing protein [Marinobacterium rhizophilum]|uniref:Cyclic nucleotide-binding domain-containing protein n=1 Tax=Marinobacterium rhizophilum TaxID=420402 RepID=A0ABY5HI85_9GAMM|nr:ABC transporter transmembrane domain-containing protein [Marinobacterium rhizophilum]UTW10686.1 cyclic nucleotide-binding domain-containing protein [Marinobacterium rhizophilum]